MTTYPIQDLQLTENNYTEKDPTIKLLRQIEVTSGISVGKAS